LVRANNESRRNHVLSCLSTPSEIDDDMNRIIKRFDLDKQAQQALVLRLAEEEDENKALLFLHSEAVDKWVKNR
jgi:hypothetical protein